MKNVKVTISYNATEKFMKSDEFRELEDAVNSGKFAKTVEQEGVKGVEVKMEVSDG